MTSFLGIFLDFSTIYCDLGCTEASFEMNKLH